MIMKMDLAGLTKYIGYFFYSNFNPARINVLNELGVVWEEKSAQKIMVYDTYT
jgi:hypothetical protein